MLHVLPDSSFCIQWNRTLFFFEGQEKNVSKGLTFVNLNISLYYLKNA